MDRREAVQRRVVGQRYGVHAKFRQARDFRGSGLHVPPGHQHQGDKTPRCDVTPVVQVPVVVGLDRRQGHGSVRVILEALAGEAGKGREAQRAEDAVGAHVVDPRLDVPGAAAHLLVTQRLHAVFLFRPADHGIEAHIAGGLLLEYPDVAPSMLFDMWLTALEALRHVPVEGSGRFDSVVVDAD
ncbi:hypothetical protein D3C85_1262830 [compost metagenome]